jgi:mannan endo-1,4-beta-mannosidase
MQRSNIVMPLVLTLLIAITRPGAAHAASIYSTSGASILKNGVDFVIHGVNINGPGVPGKRKVASDVGLIVDVWKFNFVRVSCSIAPDPKQSEQASTLDEIVKAFTARDVVVEISPRDHVGGFYEDPPKPDKSPSLADLVAWQKAVATRYKDNPNVWFEVMAGPGNRDVKLGSADWLEPHETVINAIRHDAGAQNIIVCMGYGSGYDDGNMGALNVPENQSAILTYGPDLAKRYSNIVFAFDATESWSPGGLTKLDDYLDRVESRKLPVFVAEYGLHGWSESTYAAEAVLAAGKARKLGHCAWQWTPNDRSGLCAPDDHNGGWDIDKTDGSRPANLTWLGDRVWTDNHVEPFHGPSLDRTGWTATTFRGDHLKNGQYNPADVALGGYCTEDDIWRSETGQKPGQWFQVDMGARHAFTRISIDTRAHGSDYPRAYELYVSNDGVNWGAPIAVGNNEESVLRISFPRQTARYIKFVQTGKTWHNWFVGNFEVFAPFGTPTPTTVSTKEIPVDMHGWIATANPHSWNDVHVPLRPLQYEWERASSNRKSMPGDFYQVDMQQPCKFNKIVLNSGRSAYNNEFPHGYQLFVSNDGVDWGKPIAAGRGAYITIITFPTVTARYARIVQTRETNSQWVLTEFRVYRAQ